MAAKRLAGVLPIVHTPFLDDDSIDSASLAREIDFAFTAGADGLGTGMVSEILRLTSSERIDLTKQIVDLSAGRGAVFAAVGAESIQQALVYAKAAETAGCDAIMAVPPVTTRLPEAALVDYFRALADGMNLTLIVQDASGYVGQAIPLAVYVQLLERYGQEKIVFKPEAAPIGPNLSALRDATGGRARIFEGSGGILLIDSYRRGIAGTLLLREVDKADQCPRVEDRMLGDQGSDHLFHGRRQHIVGGAQIGEFGLAVAFRARCRHLVRVQHRQRTRHPAERGIGVLQPVAEGIHAAPVIRGARPVLGVEVRHVGELGMLEAARAGIGLRRLDRTKATGEGELCVVVEPLTAEHQHRVPVDRGRDFLNRLFRQRARQIDTRSFRRKQRVQLCHFQQHAPTHPPKTAIPAKAGIHSSAVPVAG
jgi:hypothetical protein